MVTVTQAIDLTGAPQPSGSNDYQVVCRDAPLATVRPANSPDFEPNTPMPYHFHSQDNMACTHPIGGAKDDGTIYCFGWDSPAPFLVFQPEDWTKGRWDLEQCYRNESRCSGEFEVFSHHNDYGGW
ncbi:hypothetical protein DPSP01_013399 [Paraphaeosphaeria sporulosa]